MLTDEVRAHLPTDHSVVLFGLETHVCVLQTVKDLVQSNYNVFLLADGVSSRFAEDKEMAIQVWTMSWHWNSFY